MEAYPSATPSAHCPKLFCAALNAFSCPALLSKYQRFPHPHEAHMISQHSSSLFSRPQSNPIPLWPEPLLLAHGQLVWLADLPEPLQIELARLGCDPASSAQDALLLASASGNLSCVTGLASFVGRAADFPLALAKAANGGHHECCEALMPFASTLGALNAAARRASIKNQAKCLEAILASPIFSSADPCGSALILAAAQGSCECIELLAPRSTPATVGKALVQAIHGGHAQSLALLLPRAPADSIPSALSFSSKNGQLACLELLLPHADEKAKARALCSATRNGHLACLSTIAASLAKDSSLLPLHAALSTAASCGQLECLKFLASKTNVNAQGFKALREAASSGHAECAAFLATLASERLSSQTLRFPAFSPIPHLPKTAASGASFALCAAAASGQLACAELFSPQCDVEQNTQALMIAAKEGQMAFVEFLAPSANLAFDHWRVLQTAANDGQGPLLDFLLAQLARDPKSPALEAFPQRCRDNRMDQAALFFEALVEKSALAAASKIGPMGSAEPTRQRL